MKDMVRIKDIVVNPKQRDIELLNIYLRGWTECPTDIDSSSEYEGLEKRAYRIGWEHYIIGDEVTSIDGLSDEEILERIKNI